MLDILLVLRTKWPAGPTEMISMIRGLPGWLALFAGGWGEPLPPGKYWRPASVVSGFHTHRLLLGEPGYVSPAACKPGHVSPAASPIQSSGLSVATSLPSTGRAVPLPPLPQAGLGTVQPWRNPRPHIVTGHWYNNVWYPRKIRLDLPDNWWFNVWYDMRVWCPRRISEKLVSFAWAGSTAGSHDRAHTGLGSHAGHSHTPQEPVAFATHAWL